MPVIMLVEIHLELSPERAHAVLDHVGKEKRLVAVASGKVSVR